MGAATVFACALWPTHVHAYPSVAKLETIDVSGTVRYCKPSIVILQDEEHVFDFDLVARDLR